MSHSLGASVHRDKQDGSGAEPSAEGDSHAAMMYFAYEVEADAYGAPGSYTRQDLERLRRKRWPEKVSR